MPDVRWDAARQAKRQSCLPKINIKAGSAGQTLAQRTSSHEDRLGPLLALSGHHCKLASAGASSPRHSGKALAAAMKSTVMMQPGQGPSSASVCSCPPGRERDSWESWSLRAATAEPRSRHTRLGSTSSTIGPTRNRMSWIVVAGAPDRKAASKAGLRNAASSSKSVECATVTFSTPRRTSPSRVWRQHGSPTAAFQAFSNSCRARSRP